MDSPETIRDLSINEVCAILNVSPPTIYKLMNRGELESYLVGRARRITRESIERVRKGGRGAAPTAPNFASLEEHHELRERN